MPGPAEIDTAEYAALRAPEATADNLCFLVKHPVGLQEHAIGRAWGGLIALVPCIPERDEGIGRSIA